MGCGREFVLKRETLFWRNAAIALPLKYELPKMVQSIIGSAITHLLSRRYIALDILGAWVVFPVHDSMRK